MADKGKADRLVDLVRKSGANHQYFFEHLEDPGWLEPLVEAGFFQEPPPPERGDDWVRFPSWAESRYLARMASKAPELVFKVASAVPPTDNVRVHEDLVTIASQLPPELAVKLASDETNWLKAYRGPLLVIPDTAADLLVHLADAGEVEAALRLAEPLMEIFRSEQQRGTRRAAESRIDEYEYGRVIERAWPTLLCVDWAAAFDFLCERLSEVVRTGFAEDVGESVHDTTYVWRAAVEDHSQNLGNSLLDTLVEAVRDAAVDVADSPEALLAVLDRLASREGSIFKRIALHLLHVRGSMATEQVERAVTDESLADDSAVWHEWAELLRTGFQLLSAEGRAQVLEQIARGPDVQWTPELEARGVSEEDLARQKDWWKLRRYSLIADELVDDERAEYESLKEELDEPDHPSFLTYSTSWTGPTSPFTKDELVAMGPTEVAETLQGWKPRGGPEDPTPEGLARMLTEVIEGDPAAYAEAAEAFAGLDATYVRGMLGGFEAAAKEGREFNWLPVLALCRWVVGQPRRVDDATSDEWDADPHWGWARKGVASLLSRGFEEGDSQIPFDLRETAWAILEVISSDPEPTPEHEARYGADNMDPATLALNTARGEALHAVVRYVMWAERNLTEAGDFEGIDAVPEAKAVLELHLEVDRDPSLAIRAVYGMWFAQLVRLDEPWARELAPATFPSDPELSAHFRAAWDAYVVFTRPWLQVFEVLGDAYEIAVSRIGETIGRRPLAGDPDERLGEHIAWYRVMGHTGLGGDDLFPLFWSRSSAELRKHVIEHVGWSLQHRTSDIPDDVVERVHETWEWIYRDARDRATKDDGLDSLGGFGAWLASGVLEVDWALTQAKAVLELGISLSPDFAVYRLLPDLAAKRPADAVEVLRLMTELDVEGWSTHGSADEIRATLSASLASEDPEAKQRAEAVVHLLGARGLPSFRDLLSAEGGSDAAPGEQG